jgi:hypothetical protein
MAETLLRTNRRAATVLCSAAATPVLLGASLLAWRGRGEHPIISGIGGLLVCWGAYLFGRRLALLILPRLALGRGELLVYLRGLVPWRVPLDAVECFFIGQAPHRARWLRAAGRRVENVTVVVRLAERAAAWRQRDANPALGTWRDGYITLFGLWCEPLNGELVNRLNRHLAEAKRASRRDREGV